MSGVSTPNQSSAISEWSSADSFAFKDLYLLQHVNHSCSLTLLCNPSKPGCKLSVGDNDGEITTPIRQFSFSFSPFTANDCVLRLLLRCVFVIPPAAETICWPVLLSLAARGGYRILQHLQLSCSWQHRDGRRWRRWWGGGVLNFYITCIISSPPPSCPPPPSSDRHLQNDQITHYYCILSSDYRYSVQWPCPFGWMFMFVHAHTHTHTHAQTRLFIQPPSAPCQFCPSQDVNGPAHILNQLYVCVWDGWFEAAFVQFYIHPRAFVFLISLLIKEINIFSVY